MGIVRALSIWAFEHLSIWAFEHLSIEYWVLSIDIKQKEKHRHQDPILIVPAGGIKIWKELKKEYIHIHTSWFPWSTYYFKVSNSPRGNCNCHCRIAAYYISLFLCYCDEGRRIPIYFHLRVVNENISSLSIAEHNSTSSISITSWSTW